MKSVEGTNNVTAVVEEADGQVVRLDLKLAGDNGFISVGMLMRPHQADRLSTQLKQVSTQVKGQEQPEGERQ